MTSGSDLANNPRGARAYHTGIVLAVVSTVAVLLRLLARWKTKASFAADDLLIAISLLPFYVMVILTYLAVTIGHLGLSIHDIDPSDLPKFLKIIVSTSATYTLTITLVKISILLLYRRIFDTVAFRLKSFIVGLICLAWFVIAVLTGILQCQPFHLAFDLAMLFSDKCINIQAYYWGICASNVFLDLVVLYLPLHEVWKLQLPKQKKIMLSGVFTLGGLVCVAGVMRTVAISGLTTDDPTGEGVTLIPEYGWSEAEPALAIICACLVTYRPLFCIKVDLSKVSSVFSLSHSGKQSNGKLSADTSTSNLSQADWAEKENFDLRIPGLSAMTVNRSLHVVHVDFRFPRGLIETSHQR